MGASPVCFEHLLGYRRRACHQNMLAQLGLAREYHTQQHLQSLTTNCLSQRDLLPSSCLQYPKHDLIPFTWGCAPLLKWRLPGPLCSPTCNTSGAAHHPRSGPLRPPSVPLPPPPDAAAGWSLTLHTRGRRHLPRRNRGTAAQVWRAR